MNILSLFAVLFLTVPGSYTFAAPLNSTLSSSVRYDCLERASFRFTRSGSPKNCARAVIAAFPMETSLSQFHHGAPSDSFRLPISYISGDCQVTVDLDGGNPVPGSWNEVWTLANTLSTACTYYRVHQEPTSAVAGGWISANGVIVRLQKPIMGNETVASERL